MYFFLEYKIMYCFYNVICLTFFFSAGKELRDFFATCKEGHIRVVKVGLENGNKLVFSQNPYLP